MPERAGIELQVGQWYKMRAFTGGPFGRWNVQVLEVSVDGRHAKVKGGSIKAQWIETKRLSAIER